MEHSHPPSTSPWRSIPWRVVGRPSVTDRPGKPRNEASRGTRVVLVLRVRLSARLFPMASWSMAVGDPTVLFQRGTIVEVPGKRVGIGVIPGARPLAKGRCDARRDAGELLPPARALGAHSLACA